MLRGVWRFFVSLFLFFYLFLFVASSFDSLSMGFFDFDRVGDLSFDGLATMLSTIVPFCAHTHNITITLGVFRSGGRSWGAEEEG